MSDLFRPGDHSNLNLKVEMVDRARNAKKTVELVEIQGPCHIVLQVPPHSGSVGNEVDLTIQGQQDSRVIHVSLKAKILENDVLPDSVKATLELEPNQEWVNFMAFFEARQSEIDKTLAEYKG